MRILGLNFTDTALAYGAWGLGGLQWLGGTDAEARCALAILRRYAWDKNFHGEWPPFAAGSW